MAAADSHGASAAPDRRHTGWFGVYPALVSDVADPAAQGRVRIRLPWSLDPGGDGYEAWARLATLMAGDGRGSWFVPEVNDEVLVAFAAGDPRQPYVIGALWNGQDDPPASVGSGQNDLKVLRSRSGITITLDDTAYAARLTLETPNGQRITLQDGPEAIDIRDASGNVVTLTASGISVTAAGRVAVQAAEVAVSAGIVTVNAGISRFSGVVMADTVVTNSVVSSSYTPGAGNIW
jgi:uncharacterized protein involved in type VI secretion and phage assembly